MELPKLRKRDIAFIQEHRLERPADFPRWFPAVAGRLYACAGRRPRPLPARELNRLRLPRFRRGTGDVPLPPSLHAILAFDQDFVAWGSGPLCAPLLDSIGPDGKVRGVTMESVLHGAFPGMFRGLPAHVPIWGAHPEMPGLVEVHRAGDQRQFLYIAEPDGDGELPMASFDTEPALWITRASLVHYVVEALHHEGVPVAGSVDFRQLTADARNRNSRWEPKEWWDNNEQLQQFMSRYA